MARQATLRARHTLPVHFEAQPERHKRQAVFHRAAIRKGEQKSRKIHGVARNSLHKHFGQMKSNARKRETHRGKNRRRNRGLPQIDRNAPEPAEVAQCRAAAGGRLPRVQRAFQNGQAVFKHKKEAQVVGVAVVNG